MSDFCVFGVSKVACICKAETLAAKRTNYMPVNQYLQMTREIADKLFHSEKPKQVSPRFDSPQFAAEWIDIRVRGGALRSARIMTFGVRLDKNGNERMNKKGEPIIGWVPYEK